MLHTVGIGARFSHAGSSEETGCEASDLAKGPIYWKRARVLFMIRDPMDTVVSSWFQASYRSRVYDGDLASFIRDSRFGLRKIMLFHLMWLETRHRFRAFSVLRYESLQEEPFAAFHRTALFLTGRDLPDHIITQAVEAGRFEAMRRLETSGAGAEFLGVALTPRVQGAPETYKTRRGVIGGWRNYLTGADAAYAEALAQDLDYRSRLGAADVTFAPWSPHGDG